GVLLLTLALSVVLDDRDRGGIAAFVFGVALVVNDLRISGLLLLVAALIVAEGLVHRGQGWRFGALIGRILWALGLGLIVFVAVSAIQQGAFGLAVDDVASDLARPARAEAYDPTAPHIWGILLAGYPGDDAAAPLDPAFDRDAFPTALEARK